MTTLAAPILHAYWTGPHTCDLCGGVIPAESTYAHLPMLGGNVNYRAHRSCDDLYSEIGAHDAPYMARAPIFRARLAELTTSDLCELIHGQPAVEIARLVTLHRSIVTP